MIALYIIGALILLLFGVSRIRLGVRIAFGEELIVHVTAGPKRIQLIPKTEKPQKPKKAKKEKQKKPAAETETASKTKRKKPSFTFTDIRSVLPAVWESLSRALRGTGRRIRIDPLQVSVVFGGEDPAEAAEAYGWACSAMWAVMPRLERLAQLPDPHLHLDVDFSAPRTCAEGTVGLRLRIGDFVAIGSSAAWPLLKWLIARRRAGKKADPAPVQQMKTDEKIA